MWRAVLLMLLAIVSTARAGGFRDPESGLSITLGGSDAKVCYIRPKAPGAGTLPSMTTCMFELFSRGFAVVTESGRPPFL
jgi:hypothetical protein